MRGQYPPYRPIRRSSRPIRLVAMCLVRELCHECHADDMPSRVAINIGVDADEADFGDFDFLSPP